MAVSTDQESQKTAKPRGAPPGHAKRGGSGKFVPPEGQTASQQRQWMRDKSGPVIENLLRKAYGKRHKAEGPTGKSIWRETPPAMQERAEIQWLNRTLPVLSGVTLTGDKDAPLVTEHLTASSLGRDGEMARRLAIIQSLGQAPQEPADSPVDGRPINGKATHVMPSDGPGESSNGVCTPAVGESVDFDDTVSIHRLTDDGRDDHGGDFEVRAGDQVIRTLRGITLPQARDVVAAMAADGRFDG